MDQKISWKVKKSVNDGNEKKKEEIRRLPIFSQGDEDQEDAEYPEVFSKRKKNAETIKSIKGGKLCVDYSINTNNEVQDASRQHFINSLENKLNRIKNKKQIVWLNLPNGGLNNNLNDKENISMNLENGIMSSDPTKDNLKGDTIQLTNFQKDCSGKKEYAEVPQESYEHQSQVKVKRVSSNDVLLGRGKFEVKKEEDESDEEDEEEENEDELQDTLCNFHTLQSVNNQMKDGADETTTTAKEYNLTENNLAYKRKKFLEKINKKEEGSIFKDELHLYSDFKHHMMDIGNYGTYILNKMGYNEELYNSYINEYYDSQMPNEKNGQTNERTEKKNYFDRIYESMQHRTFRFMGVGAEEEMEKNLERILEEQKKDEEEEEEKKKNNKETSNRESKEEKKRKQKDGENDIYSSMNSEDRKKHHNKKMKDNNSNKSELPMKDEIKKEKEYIEVRNNYEGNNTLLFEGLLVKINLKTHEFYNRKGIVIYKKTKTKVENKKTQSGIYLGLLLFKNLEDIILHKKIIKEKIEDYLYHCERNNTNYSSDSSNNSNSSEDDNNPKHFWKLILKDLNSEKNLYSKSSSYIKNKDNKSSKKQLFEITEIKPKYVETVITKYCSKCKIVNTNIVHPKKGTSLYKETVEMIKQKSSYAYIKVRKKYELQVSFDDICESVNYL